MSNYTLPNPEIIECKGTIKESDQLHQNIYTLIASDEFQTAETQALPFIFGIDDKGKLNVKDLDIERFAVISSGNEHISLIKAYMMSLLFKKTPQQIRFIILDPKKHFSEFNSLSDIYLARTPDNRIANVSIIDDILKVFDSLAYELASRHQFLKNKEIDSYKDRHSIIVDTLLGNNIPEIVVIANNIDDIYEEDPKLVESTLSLINRNDVGIRIILSSDNPSGKFPRQTLHEVNTIVCDTASAHELCKNDQIFDVSKLGLRKLRSTDLEIQPTEFLLKTTFFYKPKFRKPIYIESQMENLLDYIVSNIETKLPYILA